MACKEPPRWLPNSHSRWVLACCDGNAADVHSAEDRTQEEACLLGASACPHAQPLCNSPQLLGNCTAAMPPGGTSVHVKSVEGAVQLGVATLRLPGMLCACCWHAAFASERRRRVRDAHPKRMAAMTCQWQGCPDEAPHCGRGAVGDGGQTRR
jgi:hypothetical protein